MNIESIKSEIERLTNDKSQTDAAIVNLEKELKKLRQSSDMLSGALQTCNYFLQKFDNEVSEEKEKDV